MKRNVTFGMLVAAVLLAVPATFGGEQKKCTADAQTCLNKMVAKMKTPWVAGLARRADLAHCLTLPIPADAAALN